MDEIWKRDEVQSPCVKICVIHEKAGICVGCYRTMQEISDWSGMTVEARTEIIAELPDRQKSLVTRRGGRKGRLTLR